MSFLHLGVSLTLGFAAYILFAIRSDVYIQCTVLGSELQHDEWLSRLSRGNEKEAVDGKAD